MKIGVLHPAFDMSGGAEFVALIVTNTLVEHGHDVELFVNNRVQQNAVQSLMGRPVAQGTKIIAMRPLFPPRGTWNVYQSAYRSLLLKSRNDLIVDTYSSACFPFTDVTYIHFPSANARSYKKVFPYLKKPRLRSVAGLPYAVYARKLQKYGSNKKLIMANSKYTAKAIREYSDIEAKVVYPPVPASFFDDQNPSSKAYGLSREDLVVTVSRFGPDKGLEKIPYIANLSEKNVRFIIIGLLHDLKTYEIIKQQIQKLGLTERVRLIPNAPRDEVKRTLKSAKIYLHTMKGEHFGISIVEAMAAGCIPIVHNSGGMTEFVPPEYRYETDIDAVERIRSGLAAHSPSEALRMRKIAEEFREENFSRNFITAFNEYVSLRGRK